MIIMRLILLILLILFISILIFYLRKYIHEYSKLQNKECRVNLQSDFDVFEVPEFLTKEECQYLIELSKDKLKPSTIYIDNGTSDMTVNKDKRKSESCRLKDSDEVVKNISDKIRILTKTNYNIHEDLEVIKYKPGGYATPHFDTCHGSKEFCEKVNGNLGPRWVTVILYLNDSYTGGETFFPRINKMIKPETGKALIFYNINPDTSVIEESYHQGLKVTQGEKWLANKWIRLNEIEQVNHVD